jgi:hypothetical protein
VARVVSYAHWTQANSGLGLKKSLAKNIAQGLVHPY